MEQGQGKTDKATALGLLVPLDRQDWDRPGQSKPSPLDRVMRADARTAQIWRRHEPDLLVCTDQAQGGPLWVLSKHLAGAPLDAQGTPRHHLLDSLLMWLPSVMATRRSTTGVTPGAVRDFLEGAGALEQKNFSAGVLLTMIRTLAQAGAVPGIEALNTLDGNQVGAMVPVTAWARNLRLEAGFSKVDGGTRRPAPRL